MGGDLHGKLRQRWWILPLLILGGAWLRPHHPRRCLCTRLSTLCRSSPLRCAAAAEENQEDERYADVVQEINTRGSYRNPGNKLTPEGARSSSVVLYDKRFITYNRFNIILWYVLVQYGHVRNSSIYCKLASNKFDLIFYDMIGYLFNMVNYIFYSLLLY